VRAVRRRDPHRSFAVTRDVEPVALFEDLDEQVTVEVAVLQDQQAFLHAATSCTDVKGSSSVKVEPAPSRLATVTSPPSVRARRREIVSPRPVPRLDRVLTVSARWNSSKIRPSSSSAIPV